MVSSPQIKFVFGQFVILSHTITQTKLVSCWQHWCLEFWEHFDLLTYFHRMIVCLMWLPILQFCPLIISVYNHFGSYFKNNIKCVLTGNTLSSSLFHWVQEHCNIIVWILTRLCYQSWTLSMFLCPSPSVSTRTDVHAHLSFLSDVDLSQRTLAPPPSPSTAISFQPFD